MIAVFKRHTASDVKCLPKSLFKEIRELRDIQGQKFEGIILEYGWHYDGLKVHAYQLLEARQPELFK